MQKFEDAEFVCLYGFDETLYQELLTWVDEKHRAAIVTQEEISSPSPFLKIYHLETILQDEIFAKQIAWSAVFLKLKVIMQEESSLFEKRLKECHLAAGLILSEAADLSVTALKNAKLNSVPSRRGLDLKNAFQGMPAIVIGAGHSLEKNKHLLSLCKEKALLMAGGAALDRIDIEPHFAAGLDPRGPIKAEIKAPFCYQSRLNSEILSKVAGEKLLFPDSFSDAINWIEGSESFNSGWTVGNFLTAVAIHLGCSPVVFIGMDFCYVDGKKYGSGSDGEEAALIQVGKYLTQSDWLMAAQWTEELGSRHELLDAGDGMLNLPKVKLEELLATWPKRDFNVQQAIVKTANQTDKRWDEWEASLAKCLMAGEEIEQEPVYEKLLLPLWQIWKPVFERAAIAQDMELHRALFFQKVISEHRNL